MATLLHFLGSLVLSLLMGFMLTLSALASGLSGLTVIARFEAGGIAQLLHERLCFFLAAFGGGSCLDGTIAIALAVGIVSALWRILSGYKHKQKNIWRLAAAGAFSVSSVRRSQ